MYSRYTPHGVVAILPKSPTDSGQDLKIRPDVTPKDICESEVPQYVTWKSIGARSMKKGPVVFEGIRYILYYPIMWVL